ncbi:MAG TPA: cupin domain-containing protein [Gammaproteobacteria bacterium]|nr:cupin domain-containing protein [Gammaproteobacteria bacterium]
MQINADISQRVVVNSHGLPWTDSPMAGVQRRMLERDGDEIARATSIVRYMPGSFFEQHTHDGGEEFLVLDGVFSDETGDFPAGMYVRNPIGSRHKPHTKEGCRILVKLRQFNAADRNVVRIDTKNADWKPGHRCGIHVMHLHEYGSEHVALMKWEPGARCNRRSYPRGMEIYVMAGTLSDEYGTYSAGTWIRSPAGFSHAPHSTGGCLVYIKTGHL